MGTWPAKADLAHESAAVFAPLVTHRSGATTVALVDGYGPARTSGRDDDGRAVGLVAPSVGKEVGVLGTMFVSLIKMMIAPVIFCRYSASSRAARSCGVVMQE